jgi:glutathione S-transferase
MLELCGFAASNYYNKVKLALLEKGIAFQEVHAYPSSAETFLAESPMGKVPYLRCPDGTLSESQAIAEYLDDAFPEKALYPADSFERAKCRELIHVMELYLELPARRLYPAAFFGGTASDELKKEVQNKVAKGARALARLLRFGPFIRGAQLTFADCAACTHLPLISGTCKTMFGEDLLGSVSGLRDYLSALGQRPHAQRVNAERKASLEAFVAYRAQLQADANASAARAR